jgi:hypothetical protein
MTPPNGVPAQNGTFRSLGTFDSFDTGAGRRGATGFTADTDGGAFRPRTHDSGSYPSFPNHQQQPPQVPPQQPPRGRGYNSLDRTGPLPVYPGNDGAFQTPVPPLTSSYNTNEMRRPDPVPSVEISPIEPEQEEYLPIFASVESAWFRRPIGEQAPESAESPRRDEQTPPQAVPSGEEAWRTAADAGWRAAAAASDPSLGGVTAAGLPKRTPKANLVPGTASLPAQPEAQQRQPAPRPPLSADRARSRLSSFQQGVRRGRAEVRGQEEQE